VKKIILFMCGVVLFYTPLHSDFNRTSAVIDIPTAKVLPHLAYRIGFDGSMALDTDHAKDNFDENIHAALGYGNKFEGYLDVYTVGNFTAAMGFAHKFYEREDMAFAWGVHHLSYAMDVSEVGHGDSVGWDDDLDYSTKENYKKPRELGSVYIVSTFTPNPFYDLTIGFGRGRYVGYGPHSKYFNSNLYHEQGDDWGIGLILGLALKPSRNLSFLLDLDGRDVNVGVKLHTMPYEFALAVTKAEQFGMSFSPRLSASLSYIQIPQERKVKNGNVVGTIMDKDGKLQGGLVRLLNTDKPKVKVNPDKGTFQFKELKPDSYEVYVWSDGFIGQKKSTIVTGGHTSRMEFVLEEKKIEKGSLVGKVVDMKTREPLVAKLTIDELAVSITSDADGTFGIANLSPGVYDIKAEVDGYETGVYPEVIEPGEKTHIVIEMIKRGMVITLEGVKFDFNKATLRPESYHILTEAAKILKNHPEIKVELQGHTDSVGSDSYNMELSDARANAVRDYLIKIHNIAPSRLFATGYGETRPVATNGTEEGRAQNRRVDFLILE
jgi:outer membrane protein OmpA-like peptidoglycan-associated protein